MGVRRDARGSLVQLETSSICEVVQPGRANAGTPALIARRQAPEDRPGRPPRPAAAGASSGRLRPPALIRPAGEIDHPDTVDHDVEVPLVVDLRDPQPDPAAMPAANVHPNEERAALRRIPGLRSEWSRENGART